MGDFVVVGFSVGFVLCTCVYFIGYALAQLQRLIRSIR